MGDDDQQQHPPMNGNDELAKALNDSSLQFEETPGPAGEGDVTPPSLDAAPQMGDPLAGIALPPLADDKPADDVTRTPQEQPKVEEPEDGSKSDDLPSVHHGHENAHHAAAPTADKSVDDKPSDDLPRLDVSADDMKLPSTGSPSLDRLKNSALEELKPLVGKLNLEPEEKFDTLMLIVRSTDDQSLLDEVHTAAKSITDETKRAQALLEIIKEVDYFSQKH